MRRPLTIPIFMPPFPFHRQFPIRENILANCRLALSHAIYEDSCLLALHVSNYEEEMIPISLLSHIRKKERGSIPTSSRVAYCYMQNPIESTKSNLNGRFYSKEGDSSRPIFRPFFFLLEGSKELAKNLRDSHFSEMLWWFFLHSFETRAFSFCLIIQLPVIFLARKSASFPVPRNCSWVNSNEGIRGASALLQDGYE